MDPQAAGQIDFRRLFEASPEGIAVVSCDGRWLWVNQALCELVGYHATALLARGSAPPLRAFDLAGGAPRLHRLARGELGNYTMRRRHRRPDGRLVWMLIACTLVRDDHGEPLQIVLQTEDITQARQVEQDLEREQRLLAESQAAGRIGSWELDLETGVQRWSDEQFSIFGVDPAAQAPQLDELLSLVHPDDRQSMLESLRANMESGATFTDEYRVLHPTLGTRRLVVRGRYLPRDADGRRPARLAGTTHDVTAEREAEAARWALAERQRLLLASLPDAVVGLFDEQLRCALLQGEILAKNGIDPASLIGRPLSEMLPAGQSGQSGQSGQAGQAGQAGQSGQSGQTGQTGHSEHAERMTAALRQALAGSSSTVELVLAGRTYQVEVWPYRLDQDSIGGAFAVGRDITERKRDEAELKRLATHDELTGLANRRTFDQRIADELARARRYGHGLSLVLMDIDHFKRINDTFGHPVGDRVLADIARTLRAMVREHELIARVGGEEFAWILPEANAVGALAAAERAFAAVAGRPLEYVSPVTLSAGICPVSEGLDATELYRRADNALLAAKQAGRDRIVVYSADCELPATPLEAPRSSTLQRR